MCLINKDDLYDFDSIYEINEKIIILGIVVIINQ
jgi:hypothetical protein